MITSTHTRRSTMLTQGQSISLTTGQVDVAPANGLPSVSAYCLTRLSSNDLNALRSAFEIMSCAWTERACHQHVDHCPQHPRKRCDKNPSTCDGHWATDPNCWYHS